MGVEDDGGGTVVRIGRGTAEFITGLGLGGQKKQEWTNKCCNVAAIYR